MGHDETQEAGQVGPWPDLAEAKVLMSIFPCLVSPPLPFPEDTDRASAVCSTLQGILASSAVGRERPGVVLLSKQPHGAAFSGSQA